MNGRDRFWALLPEIYRRRDAEGGGALRALLEAFAEQAAVIDQDIARLYDNWFIETCEDWAVPYIADLIGWRPVHEAGAAADPDDGREARPLDRILVPRREVANTARYRRRKGSLSLLETLARDVAGWPAKAVEFGTRLSATQHAKFPTPDRGRTVDLRRRDVLADLGGFADGLARGCEVRGIDSARGRGRHGPFQVGLFVARARTHSVRRAEALCLDARGANCFTFDALGRDVPLFVAPDRVGAGLPGPLTRRALAGPGPAAREGTPTAAPDHFGEHGSLMIWARRGPDGAALEPVPADRVVPADLRGWRYRPAPGLVAVDPERGRIAFSERGPPKGLLVSYHHGAAGDVGAGEYRRPRRPPAGADRYRVAAAGGHEAHESVAGALARWRRDAPRHAVIELADSRIYEEQRVGLELGEGQHLEIRAAAGTRPLIRLADLEAAREDAWRVSGGKGSRLTLDGLLVSGRSLQVRGSLGELVLRRCTLVPGWGLAPDGSPRHPRAPSLALEDTSVGVRIEHSILGAIHVRDEQTAEEPNELVVTDSVIDAGAPAEDAILGTGTLAAYVALTIRRSTVLGRGAVHEVGLAENSVFTGPLRAARRQRGCVRFCFLPPGSRTPRTFACLPPAADPAATVLAPVFVSTRYGDPGYCQLADDCPAAIRHGADDRSELGVFHDLFNPQREANLRARLAEYVPAGVDVGIVHVS